MSGELCQWAAFPFLQRTNLSSATDPRARKEVRHNVHSAMGRGPRFDFSGLPDDTRVKS